MMEPQRRSVQAEPENNLVLSASPGHPKFTPDELDRVARLFVLLATVSLPDSSNPCGDEELPQAE